MKWAVRTLTTSYVTAFAAAYVVAMVALTLKGVYPLAEPIFVLAVFGIVLPSIALALSRRCSPLSVRVEARNREILTTFALVAFIVLYLVWGSDRVDALIFRHVDETPRLEFFLTIAKKLVVFVLVPYIVLSRAFGYRWRDFGFVKDWRTAFRPPYLVLMLVFFALYLAIQFLAGQAAQPVFRGEFPATTVIVGSIFSYCLLVLEVGLVEEFFFRAVLQARLAVWLKSEVGGLLLMALIFGLAHAPGLYLREAGSVTSLGATPDLVSVLAYSIAVLSLAALAFGVIWMKTRNIYVLILIHAWVDTLPGLPAFIEIFNLQ